MRAFLHASLTTHVILSHCILPLVPCCFPVESPVGLPWLFVNILHSTGRVSPVQAKTTAGAFRFVRMQSVSMLPGCCHSCTPIAHAAPVLMFLNSNNMKRTFEMCPKFTLTYINVSTIYGHESISAQELCICAQEKYSVNIHPNARIHIRTIHTYKFIYNQYVHIYKSVYACNLSWYYLHAVILLHTLPDTALITNPSCASLRSRCAFVFEKHRTFRKSALYKEPSIRTRILYLHKRTLHLHTRATHVFVYIHIYIYVYTYIHIYIYMYLNTCIVPAPEVVSEYFTWNVSVLRANTHTKILPVKIEKI